MYALGANPQPDLLVCRRPYSNGLGLSVGVGGDRLNAFILLAFAQRLL